MDTSAEIVTEKSIILFDGVCNFCNSSINFVIDHDSRQNFVFASLQSDKAKEIIDGQEQDLSVVDSLILVDDDKVYIKSSAALRIARRLSFPWNLAYALVVIPRFLRDPIYDWIARNRYKWFGKMDQCRIPTEDLRARFIEHS